jgi:hypothetical protein
MDLNLILTPNVSTVKIDVEVFNCRVDETFMEIKARLFAA